MIAFIGVRSSWLSEPQWATGSTKRVASFDSPTHAMRNKPFSTVMRHTSRNSGICSRAHDRLTDVAQYGVQAVQVNQSFFGVLAAGDLAAEAVVDQRKDAEAEKGTNQASADRGGGGWICNWW